MKTEEFYIDDLDLQYFVGLGKLTIQGKKPSLDHLFKSIESIQKAHDQVVIQFFNDEYVLNEDHVYSAIYFVQNAFASNLNIATSKNIEFLLYLAANRQISMAMKFFGITTEHVNQRGLNFCIISSQDNLTPILQELLQTLKAEESELELGKNDLPKLQKITNLFKFNEEQIKTIMESYGIKKKTLPILLKDTDMAEKVLLDLIGEEMALLSLEKIKLE